MKQPSSNIHLQETGQIVDLHCLSEAWVCDCIGDPVSPAAGCCFIDPKV